jgi:tetratricopeptide (TPR) repeat protein
VNTGPSPLSREKDRETLRAHLERADFAAAESLAQDLLAQNPGDFELLYLAGLTASRADRIEEAIARFERALAQAPNRQARAAVLQALGKSHWTLLRLELAEAALAEAARLAPDDPNPWIDLGAVRKSLGEAARALEAFTTALAIEPDSAEARIGAGLCEIDLGRIAEGRRALESALAMAPGQPEAENGLALIDQLEGRLEAAEARLLRLLGEHPEQMGAFGLASLRPFATDDDPRLVLFEKRQAEPVWTRVPEIVRIDLDYALAKADHDLGRTASAFSRLAQASRRRRALFLFDVGREEERLERIASLFTRDFIERFRLHRDAPPSCPVFIVGLPRSGSTLLEQLLAGHPEITPAGEFPVLPRLATDLSLSWGRLPGFPAALTEGRAENDLRSLARRYFESLRGSQGEVPGPVFTDKHLGNFLFAGLIRMAFPDARIIHTRRHPLDQALSAYRQLFTYGHPYTYDLAEFGRYYIAYRRLMTHWQSVVGEILYDLSYETLVADPEAALRPLFDFLDLPFDPAGLATGTRNRPVRTASAVQVRAPVHAESVGVWKRYREELEPLRASLASWIPEETGD